MNIAAVMQWMSDAINDGWHAAVGHGLESVRTGKGGYLARDIGGATVAVRIRPDGQFLVSVTQAPYMTADEAEGYAQAIVTAAALARAGEKVSRAEGKATP